MGRKTEQHKYFTEEKWIKVNEVNRTLTDEFMDYLTASGKSKETIKVYYNNLQIFFVWVLENLNDKSVVEINKKDIMKWQNFMVKLSLSSSRIRIMRSSVSSLCNYIENMCDDEYPDFRNIVNKVLAPKLQYIREKTFITEDEFNIIKDELIKNNDWQKVVYLCISYDSACRRGEAFRILKNIDFENNKTNVVVGKGGKIFSLYFDDNTKEYIKKWLEIRGNDDCDKLFVVKKDGKVSEAKYATLYNWCNVFTDILKEKTGSNKVVYPHSLRGSRLTTLHYEKNVAVNVLQEFAHHSDPSTTLNHYIEKRENDVINKIFNHIS